MCFWQPVVHRLAAISKIVSTRLRSRSRAMSMINRARCVAYCLDPEIKPVADPKLPAQATGFSIAVW